MRTYFALVGALCLAGAIWLAVQRLRARLFGLVARGTVVGHEARECDDSMSYLPVVVFSDPHGIEFRFTSAAGWFTRQPVVGTEVPVRYMTTDPRIAYIETFLHMWAAPLAGVVLGVTGIAALWVP